MTTAQLLIRRNTDAWQTGGVSGTVGDVITLGYTATDGVRAQQSHFEIYGAPPGYPKPTGWVDAGNGIWTYQVDGASPQFTIDRWGKYMLSLRLNGAADTDLNQVDFSSSISVLDTDGKEDVGRYETSQFHSEWSEGLRNTLRIVGAGGGGGSDPTKLALNGSNSMAADLPLGGHKGVNGAAGTNPNDLVILSQLTGLTADDIGAAFAINSFALAGTGYTSVKRRGDAISTVTATASYVRTPTSASIANSYGGSSNGSDVAGGSWSISTPFTSATMSGSVQRFGSSGGADPTWTATLTATNKTTKTAAASAVWTGDCYAGMVSAAPANSAQVQALSSVLSQTTARIWTVSGTAQNFCSCYPASRGQATYKFHSSGFGIPVATTTVSVTRNGATDLYNVDTSYNVFTLSSEQIEVIL